MRRPCVSMLPAASGGACADAPLPAPGVACADRADGEPGRRIPRRRRPGGLPLTRARIRARAGGFLAAARMPRRAAATARNVNVRQRRRHDTRAANEMQTVAWVYWRFDGWLNCSDRPICTDAFR